MRERKSMKLLKNVACIPAHTPKIVLNVLASVMHQLLISRSHAQRFKTSPLLTLTRCPHQSLHRRLPPLCPLHQSTGSHRFSLIAILFFHNIPT
jgi:hypothetical protein